MNTIHTFYLAKLENQKCRLQDDLSHSYSLEDEYLGTSFNSKRQNQLNLDEVCKAITRIRAGQFGICKCCHNPIEPGRLDIYPTTEFCAPCNCRMAKNQSIRNWQS